MNRKRTGLARVVFAGVFGFLFVAADCGPNRIDPASLVAWSPDGGKAAVVPSALTLEDRESGVWVLDAASGQSRLIFSPGPKLACLQPQWSPFTDEILFVTIPVEEDEEDIRSYCLWTIRSNGEALRRLAEGTTTSEVTPLLMPNSVMWGAFPGTVVFQVADDKKVGSECFDPYTGRRSSFLPGFAESYSIQPSPDRRLVSAIQFEDEGRTGRVLISEFGYGNWRALGDIRTDPVLLENGPQMIFWAPDSSSFLVPEAGDTPSDEDSGLRRFDARTGTSEFFATGRIIGPVLWERSGNYYLYSVHTGVFRARACSRWAIPLIQADDPVLLGWNRSMSRFAFGTVFQDSSAGFFTAAADGSSLNLIPALQAAEGDAFSVGSNGALVIVRASGEPQVQEWSTP